ncbi:MAG: DoxX family protein [Anaerolineaceae bacterium]|nr:DoxX family protein [Anaerolineaceae bacterium]
MNEILWILQGLLGLVFLITGTMKIIRTKEQLAAQMGWVNDVSQPVIRLIGFVEILGAVGLILPSVTGMLPWLTPLAAAGLALTMVGAALTNYRRKELPLVGLNTVLLVLALLVWVGRFWIVPL